MGQNRSPMGFGGFGLPSSGPPQTPPPLGLAKAALPTPRDVRGRGFRGWPRLPLPLGRYGPWAGSAGSLVAMLGVAC
jgi:hypothetical protein